MFRSRKSKQNTDKQSNNTDLNTPGRQVGLIRAGPTIKTGGKRRREEAAQDTFKIKQEATNTKPWKQEPQLSVCLPVCLSTCLFTCLSTCLSSLLETIFTDLCFVFWSFRFFLFLFLLLLFCYSVVFYLFYSSLVFICLMWCLFFFYFHFIIF